MNLQPGLNGQRHAFPRLLVVRNQVLLVLVIVALAAVASSGFVGDAPNRLVSGRPISLWSGADPMTKTGIALLGAGLSATCFVRRSKPLHCAVAILAAALLLLALTAAGQTASHLTQSGRLAARISLGPAFWVLATCTALALADALQRLEAGPGRRDGKR